MKKTKTDAIKITGHLKAVLRDKFGKIKDIREVDNVVTTNGKYHIADQLASTHDESEMSHMAIGTGTTAASASDTALESELDRNALTSRTQGSGASANTVVYVGDWAAGDGTGSITEAGIFNASSGGTLLCRQVFSAINKGASDTLQITWTLTIS